MYINLKDQLKNYFDRSSQLNLCYIFISSTTFIIEFENFTKFWYL